MLLLSLSAFALECDDLNPESCAATLAITEAVNSDGVVIADDAASSRFRSSTVYAQIEALRSVAFENDCTVSVDQVEVAFEGVHGGRYDVGLGTHDGSWSSLHDDGAGSVDGAVHRGAQTWSGTARSDDGDLPLAVAGGLYNRSNQVAGDREDGFLMGFWTRTTGRRGIYYAAYGQCEGSFHEAFSTWYPGLEAHDPFVGTYDYTGTCGAPVHGTASIDFSNGDGVYVVTSPWVTGEVFRVRPLEVYTSSEVVGTSVHVLEFSDALPTGPLEVTGILGLNTCDTIWTRD